ncbi:drug/metabolite transporter (DMT)-like permease [Hasllibacter halocynthiae]|uniref:Drug/metabolite transporter (DMT)-like permease n=1 Tax=Hasllibacter halocynthiae TaxID=595589 RepID=A0A2T0X353_9RHOB|nr:DMT family transporter [Hasllibacter halocynthiae]PRY93370.1 drug/metabolite transporter (DMT)-like permease [Hasllibacter halocynthiae]
MAALETTRTDDPARGIALKCAAVALFVGMQAIVKAAAGAGVPPGEAVFFRSLFSLPVILLWLAATGHLHDGLRVRSVPGHLARGVFGTSAMGLRFLALGLLPLYEVQAIGYATPLLVVVFAVLFAGERVRLTRSLAVLLGLAGVLIVAWPNLGGMERSRAALVGTAAVLASAALAAMAQTMIRRLVEHEGTAAIVFWFAVSGVVLSALTAPFGWIWPGWWMATLLAVTGLVGGVAQIFLTASYRYADAGTVAPFDYTSLLWAIGIGMVLFDEAPDARTLAGAALVIGAGILVAVRERRLGLERRRARAAKSQEG